MSFRITRSQANSDEELRNEIEAFNPFAPRRELPRGEEEFLSVKSSESETSLNSDVDSTIINTDRFIEISDSSEEEHFNNTMANEGESTSSGTNNRMMMVPSNINFTIPLKDAVKVVPEFDGHNIPLSQFFEGCDEALSMIEPQGESNLVKLIKGKIIGEAKRSLCGQKFTSIKQLKEFLKNIYSSVKSVEQLLGELGNEYQREKDTVIAFANRIREIGNRIIESETVLKGEITQQFRSSIENSIVECFKSGLKPEIEQRLGDITDVNEVVKEAIKIERKLITQDNLRRGNRPQFEPRQISKRIHICQVCKKEGHEATECLTLKNKICQFCRGTNHTSENCWKRPGDRNAQPMTCQLCNKIGHTAKYCRDNLKCLKCNKNGHLAKFCTANNYTLICQICNKPGHKANTCYLYKPTQQNIPDPYKSRGLLHCQICDKVGHTGATCKSRDNTIKECTYCKNKGHTYEECRKRQSGNERGLHPLSAKMESSQNKQRSTHTIQTENYQSELIQSTLNSRVN